MTSRWRLADCNTWGTIFSIVHPMTSETAKMPKHPLSFATLRKVPPPFSWVDQRLVRERSIDQLTHEACALYLFLVTVADAQGLRYDSERSLCRR